MVDHVGRAAYRQVADDLRARIAADEFATTRKLPSISEIKERYEVSDSIARWAVYHLKADGLVMTRQGKGAYLAHGAADRAQQPRPAVVLTEARQQFAEMRQRMVEMQQAQAALGESFTQLKARVDALELLTAEELPLEDGSPQTSGDHASRNIDQRDAEGDQTDSRESQKA